MFCCLLGHWLRLYLFHLLFVLVTLSVIAKWLARKTPHLFVVRRSSPLSSGQRASVLAVRILTYSLAPIGACTTECVWFLDSESDEVVTEQTSAITQSRWFSNELLQVWLSWQCQCQLPHQFSRLCCSSVSLSVSLHVCSMSHVLHALNWACMCLCVSVCVCDSFDKP